MFNRQGQFHRFNARFTGSGDGANMLDDLIDQFRLRDNSFKTFQDALLIDPPLFNLILLMFGGG